MSSGLGKELEFISLDGDLESRAKTEGNLDSPNSESESSSDTARRNGFEVITREVIVQLRTLCIASTHCMIQRWHDAHISNKWKCGKNHYDYRSSDSGIETTDMEPY